MSSRRFETEEQKAARQEKQKLEEFRQQKLQDDCSKLLQLPEFQRVMSEIIGMGGIFRTVMTGNSATYHLAGKQDYAKQILMFLARADKDAALELLKTQQLDLE